jgi:hypothetical protein
VSDPWLRFYTTDWRSDPRLRMCSAAARGMWIEMICLMHEATPYGHLLIHGQSPNEAQLASLTGIPAAELPHLVAELERLGVFSRTKEGVIYSRKLVRMASRAAKARRNGKLGGNPSLRKDDEKDESVNPQDKGGDKPQIPEPIYQRLPDADASGTAGGAPVDFTKEVFDRGVAYLGRHGEAERRARALIGLWRKQVGDTETFNALRDAAREGITEPVAWITARLKPKPAQPDVAALMASIRGNPQ